MKKLLFSACLLARFRVFAQQENTLSQNGNVEKWNNKSKCQIADGINASNE